jgi:membrane-associated phospholipid phosphatase
MKAVAVALLIALPVQAKSWTDASPEDKVGINLPVDVALTSLGLVSFVVPELLKGEIAPAHCVVCNPDLNGVDATFHDALTGWVLPRKTADTVSNVWAFALLPIASVGSALVATGPHASDGAGLRAGVIVLESAALSAAAVQSVKFFVARERPFAHYGHGDSSSTYSVDDRDSHLSFPSGHTALATSLGVSLAMTAQLEDSRAAPWLWGAAAAMSISTGALRMIAEKHYFTDVAAGALVGAATGVIVPLLHRRGSALAGQVSVTPSVVSFSVAM